MSERNVDFSHSFTDLMSSLAVVFLLVAGGFVILITNKHNNSSAKVAETEINDLKTEIQEFKIDIDKVLNKAIQAGTRAEVDGYKVRIRFSEIDRSGKGLFFERNNFKLSAGAKEYIARVLLPVIRKACEHKVRAGSRMEMIVLEGHTDSSPLLMGPGCQAEGRASLSEVGFCNNVRLSANRASEVFFNLRSLLSTTEIKSCIDPAFLVSGRGSAAPAHVSATATELPTANNDRRDRRVELVFHFSPSAEFDRGYSQ